MRKKAENDEFESKKYSIDLECLEDSQVSE